MDCSNWSFKRRHAPNNPLIWKLKAGLRYWKAFLSDKRCSLSCLDLNLYTPTVPILHVLIHLSLRLNVTCSPQLLCVELLWVKTLCLANFLAKPKFQTDKFKPRHAVLGLTAVRLWSRETMRKELRQGSAQENICFPFCLFFIDIRDFPPSRSAAASLLWQMSILWAFEAQ